MTGIYKITSPSGKIYIGQSLNILRRWNSYKYNSKKSVGPKIYNSISKYGYSSHIFETIEQCDKEQLKERELYWKKYYVNKCGWENVLFCDLYDKGGGKRSEETCKKISLNRKGKVLSEDSRRKISNSKKGKVAWNKGIPMSDELKQKMSEQRKGWVPWNKGKSHSETVKKRMSDFWKGKRKGAEHPRAKRVMDVETGKIYESVSQFMLEIKKTPGSTYRSLKIGKIKYI